MFVILALSLLFTFAFLAANFVPRSRYHITTFPYPGSNLPVTTPAELRWGWPLIFRKDVGTIPGATKDPLKNPRYSLEHALGHVRFDASDSRYSVAAGLGNVASLVSGLALLVILILATMERRFALKSMFITIACMAVWIATFTWVNPLSEWDPMYFDLLRGK